MEKLFKLKENGTDVRTEVLAGITTFMTMAFWRSTQACSPQQAWTLQPF